MNTITTMTGYTVHLIPSKKFKNITMSLKLCNELTRENITKRTLLSFMFTAGTNTNPSPKHFSTYLEGMYGARFSSSISSKGKASIINLSSVVVNEKFLIDKENLLEKQVEIFKDVLLHPYIIDNKFDDKIFEIKKKELKEKIRANKDDKFTYSFEQLLKTMGKETYLGISTSGYEQEIDQIGNEELYQYLLTCLLEDKKYLYIVGDIDETIIDSLNNTLSFDTQPTLLLPAYNFITTNSTVNEVIETQEINQAKLNMGYSIDCNLTSEHHYAFTLFNAIFGGYSQSKLFKVVREEHSLCYYVSSNYDAFNGVMMVCAGIENNDYEKTKDLIQEQLKAMQDGEFSQEELDMAKMMLKNAYVKSNDEPGSMIAMAFNRDLIGKKDVENKFLEQIQAITKDDIINASKAIKLDTIFLLTGGEK